MYALWRCVCFVALLRVLLCMPHRRHAIHWHARCVCVCVPTQEECVRCGNPAVNMSTLCANHAAIAAQRSKNNTASGAGRQWKEAERAAAKAAAKAGKEAREASVGMAAWGAPV